RKAREDDHPEQPVAVLRAALDVGGEVAGVHVRHRGDEGGAGERQQGAQSAAPPLEGLRRGLARAIREGSAAGSGDGRHQPRLPLTKMPRASPSGTLTSRPSSLASTGLSNSLTASMTSRAPGTSPRRL